MSRQSIKDRYDSAITIVKRDLLAKSVVKATTEEEIPPKEKHLTALELYTRNTVTPMPDLVSQLQLRLGSSNWFVIAKALMTIHHLLINGEERFALYLTSNLSILNNLFNFPELIIEQNKNIINFLNNYVEYLKNKLETYYKLGIDITKSAASLNFEEKTVKDLLPICSSMNSLAKSIFATEIHKHSLSSKMLLFIFNLIYLDVSKLYCCYNNVLTILLKEFYNSDKKLGQSILEEFESYLKNQHEFSLLFESAKQLLETKESIDVNIIDKKVYEDMKAHLNSSESFIKMENVSPPKKPQGDLDDLFSTDYTSAGPSDFFSQPPPVHQDNFGFSSSNNVMTSNQPPPSQNQDFFGFDDAPFQQQPTQQAPPMQEMSYQQFSTSSQQQWNSTPSQPAGFQFSNPMESQWMGSISQVPQQQSDPNREKTSDIQSLISQQIAHSNNPLSSQIPGVQPFSSQLQQPMFPQMQQPIQPSMQQSFQPSMQQPMQPSMQQSMFQQIPQPMQPPMYQQGSQPMQNSMFGGQNTMNQGGMQNPKKTDPFDFFS